MENLCNICVRVTEEYKKYKFIYSETEKETFLALKRFQKALQELGEDHEIFNTGCKKFWEKNKDSFNPKNWEENVVKFLLYDEEGEMIKGPVLYLSQISYLAEEVDKQRPKREEKDLMKFRLDKALFKVISSVDENFQKKQIVEGGGNALPFDFSKIGDVISKIVDSGIISNSDKVDKEDLMQAVNSFVANPKLNDILGSVVQALGGKEGSINSETIKEVFSGVNTANE